MMVLRVRRRSCLCNYGIRLKKERLQAASALPRLKGASPLSTHSTEVVCGETSVSVFSAAITRKSQSILGVQRSTEHRKVPKSDLKTLMLQSFHNPSI